MTNEERILQKLEHIENLLERVPTKDQLEYILRDRIERELEEQKETLRRIEQSKLYELKDRLYSIENEIKLLKR